MTACPSPRAIDLRNRLADLLGEIYRPPSALRAWQWVEQHVMLGEEEAGARAGLYSTAYTPYIRRLFDFAQNPGERELWVRKSSQVGFTLGVLGLMAYVAQECPAHFIYAINSLAEARKISTGRMLPILENLVGCGNRVRFSEDADQSALFLRLPRMDIHVIGGHSAGAMANKSARWFVLDELDQHAPSPNGGSSTSYLARSRVKKFPDSKIIGLSKPEDWEGPINQEWLNGTREEFRCPCPHCGHRQAFLLEQFRFGHCKDLQGEWDYARLLAEVYYECAGCQGKILEKQKFAMMQAAAALPDGGWVATNDGSDKEHKAVPGVVSIWINDFYSPLPGSTWGQIILEFVKAQDNPAQLKHWFRDRYGLPGKNQESETTLQDVLRLQGPYEHCSSDDHGQPTGLVPVLPALHRNGRSAAILIASDVQADVAKWVKVLFTPTEEIYVLDYGKFLACDDLLVEARVPVRCLDPTSGEQKEFKPSIGVIDEGYDTKAIREFCQRSKGFFHPSRGTDARAGDIVAAKVISHNNRPLTVYHFIDAIFKKTLYLGHIGEFDRIRSGHSPYARLWLPAHVEHGFCKELTAERCAWTRKRGQRVLEWIDPEEANDWGDALKNALVLWYVIRKNFALKPRAFQFATAAPATAENPVATPVPPI